jgi:hypothetical protein
MGVINVPVFLCSLIFGLVYMYFYEPDNKEVIVYPTKDNSHQFQFRDKIDNCFQLQQTMVACSSDAEEIPVQI